MDNMQVMFFKEYILNMVSEILFRQVSLKYKEFSYRMP